MNKLLLITQVPESQTHNWAEFSFGFCVFLND